MKKGLNKKIVAQSGRAGISSLKFQIHTAGVYPGTIICKHARF
jgi:hypothetical protein